MADWNEVIIVRIKELLAQVEDQWGDLKKFNSLKNIIANMGVFKEIAQAVILAVEQTYREFEEFDKEVRLDYAAKVLDDLIPLPGILEWFDGKIFRILLSMGVAFLNDRWGHDWTKVIHSTFDFISGDDPVA